MKVGLIEPAKEGKGTMQQLQRAFAWQCALVACLCLMAAPLILAQTTENAPNALTQQLSQEFQILSALLQNPETTGEQKEIIQRLLELNRRGHTIEESRQLLAAGQANAASAPRAVSPPAANNLAEAEAAPLPANVNVGGGSMLQNFSKGRDAEASSKAASSLGLVKAQQDMENVTRESEAKQREAQNIRNQAGATALAQRQQDAASMASQQAAGSMGNMLGDSLVQSVQQGAQAAGQAIGGGAVGRMSGAGGSGGGVAGGAAAAGASAAAGQIFGGSSGSSVPTPGAVGDGMTAEPAVGGGQPVAPSASGGGVAAAENAALASGVLLHPQSLKASEIQKEMKSIKASVGQTMTKELHSSTIFKASAGQVMTKELHSATEYRKASAEVKPAPAKKVAAWEQ